MKVTVIKRDGTRIVCEGGGGRTLMEVLKANGMEIPASCAGSMACSTCHVVVDRDWHERLPEATEDEEDVLDMIPDVTTTSRLSCQIRCTEEFDGLTVRLPESVRNLLSR